MEGPVKATSPACSRPQGTVGEMTGLSQAATFPSGFGVPHTTLPEDTPPLPLSKTDSPVTLTLKESTVTTQSAAVDTYRPPTPVEPPLDQGAWVETG